MTTSALTALCSSVLVSLALVACGDASGNSQNYYRAGQGTDNSSGGTSGGTVTQTDGGTSGDTGGGSTGGGTTQGQALTVDLSASSVTGELYEYKQFIITVSGKNYTGKAALALDGVDATVLDAKLDKASLDLTPGAGQTAMVTVRSHKGGDSNFNVKITAGTETISKPLTLTATKVLTITIANGAQANKADPALFGTPDSTYSISNAIPLTLNFKNLDASGHIIHGPNVGGFVHGGTGANDAIKTNTLDAPRTITTASANGYKFYLHDDQGTTGTLVVTN